MNVLMVNKFFHYKGGSETVFFSEMDMLEKLGNKVVPFAMKSELNGPSIYDNYFVEEVDYTKPGFFNKIICASKIIYSFDARKKILQLLKSEEITVSHFHIFQHQISPSVFGPLKDRNIPIILSLHDLKPICPNYKYYVNGNTCEACSGGEFINCFRKKCTKGSSFGSLVNTVEMYFHRMMGYYENVDRYIAVSKFYKRKMIEAGFEEEKISYLPNYIDTEDFYSDGKDNRYVLYFGRLSEEKGVATLIKSAEINKDITHYIVGTGPLDEGLRYEVQNKSLTNIKFLGFKTGNELKRLLSECTCVVVPSEWYENCPMTILEAFASSKPVIGSNIGGIPELIENGIDGYTFEPGDEMDLADKVRTLWNEPSLCLEMGLKGLEKVKNNFNAEMHSRGLINIYNEVLGNY